MAPLWRVNKTPCSAMAKSMIPTNNEASKHTLSWSDWFAIAVATVPFFVKRAILLEEHSYVFWLATDYGARTLSLVGVAMARRAGLLSTNRPAAGVAVSVAIFAVLVVAELNLQAHIYPILRDHLHYLALSHFPSIPSRLVKSIDLTFGLLLVALSEESVFRSLLIALLERWNIKSWAVIILSSAAFALIHLTSGVADAVNAFLHGLLLGTAYWKTRRLSVCVASHYLVDLYTFGW